MPPYEFNAPDVIEELLRRLSGQHDEQSNQPYDSKAMVDKMVLDGLSKEAQQTQQQAQQQPPPQEMPQPQQQPSTMLPPPPNPFAINAQRGIMDAKVA